MQQKNWVLPGYLRKCKCEKGCKTNSCSLKCASVVCTYSSSCNINDDCENTNHYKLYEIDEEEND